MPKSIRAIGGEEPTSRTPKVLIPGIQRSPTYWEESYPLLILPPSVSIGCVPPHTGFAPLGDGWHLRYTLINGR
jgi:hypothetical protein